MDRTRTTRIARRPDSVMSYIGKGNHLIKDALHGRRGEKQRRPEMVEPVDKKEKAGHSKDAPSASKTDTHTPTSRSIPSCSHGTDGLRSVAVNRPPTRRKKTRHVDELIFQNGETFHCSICLKVYQSLRAAREHIKLKHNERYRQ